MFVESLLLFIHDDINDEESSGSLDSLIQDIEHVIYNIDTGVHNIRDMTISSVDTDEGLVKPYGIGEIEILIEYGLDIEN